MQCKRLVSVMAVTLVIGLLVLTLIVGCAQPTSETKWEIKLQSNATLEDDPKWQSAAYFAERVDYHTNGRVVIDVRPRNELCDMKTAVESASTGAVPAIMPMTAYISGSHPETMFEMCPGLVPGGSKDLLPLLDAGIWDILDASFARDNVKLVSYFTEGAKTAGLGKTKYLKRPEDFEGLKMSAPGGMELEMLKALGAGAVRIPGPDVYMSLQTGVIDAAYSGLQGIWNDKLYELTPYIVYYGNDLVGEVSAVLFFNMDLWNQFPEEVQEGILKAGRDVTDNVTIMYHTPSLEKIINDLEGIGVMVERLTPAERDALQALTVEPMQQWYAEQGGDMGKDILAICTQ